MTRDNIWNMEGGGELSEEMIRRAEDALHGLPFSQMIGMRLEGLRPGEADISVEMRDELRQPHGLLHGGVTAALIDTAMAFAVITKLAPEERASTVDLHVHYLRPHLDGKVTCAARIVKAGRSIFTVSADVHDENGVHISTGLSTYAKVPRDRN